MDIMHDIIGPGIYDSIDQSFEKILDDYRKLLDNLYKQEQTKEKEKENEN